MSRRPYVREVSKTRWYFRHRRYLRYMSREITCIFIGAFALLLLCALGRLADGQAAYESFLAALGHAPSVLHYAQLHAFAAHWFGKVFLLTVIALFLWHAAHRLRVTLHDFGLRQDAAVAVIVYVIAAAGTLMSVLYLSRI